MATPIATAAKSTSPVVTQESMAAAPPTPMAPAIAPTQASGVGGSECLPPWVAVLSWRSTDVFVGIGASIKAYWVGLKVTSMAKRWSCNAK